MKLPINSSKFYAWLICKSFSDQTFWYVANTQGYTLVTYGQTFSMQGCGVLTFSHISKTISDTDLYMYIVVAEMKLSQNLLLSHVSHVATY